MCPSLYRNPGANDLSAGSSTSVGIRVLKSAATLSVPCSVRVTWVSVMSARLSNSLSDCFEVLIV